MTQTIDYKKAWEELKEIVKPGSDAPSHFREHMLEIMNKLEHPRALSAMMKSSG